MAAKSWKTIRIPRNVFERHNSRRRRLGLTWAAYFDHQAPEYVTPEDVVREAAREAVEAELAASDLAALVEDEPEPLAPLAVDTYCNVCEEDVGDRSGTCAHLLKEHAAEVNAFIAELRARQNGTEPEGDREESDEVLRVNDGPVSFGEVPVDRPGSPWGNGTTPARECDGCGETLSKGYAKVFSRGHDGYLRCPDCASRSQRYTLDSPADGGGRTDPSSGTGTSNSQYRPADPPTPDAES